MHTGLFSSSIYYYVNNNFILLQLNNISCVNIQHFADPLVDINNISISGCQEENDSERGEVSVSSMGSRVHWIYIQEGNS